jgi:membrane fusion protein (multidrug efflux system)
MTDFARTLLARWLRPLLLIAVPAAVVLAALGWWLWGGRHVATENAYVKADIAQISPEISGRVAEVLVKDHAEVKAGNLLLRIDPEPFRMALARAEAEVDSTRGQVATLIAAWREAVSELAEAESKVRYWDAQLARQRQLTTRGVVSSSKFEEVESSAIAARDRVAVQRDKVERTLASLGRKPERPIDEHPLVRQKIAERDRARLDLERTTIAAPVSGIAVNVKLQPGEQVRASTPIFSIVAATQPWVEANFKETELTHVRPGQPAKVVLDIYPDVTWEAEVESISPATGAEFAILPPQNASGNWVKVVQRLPVKLRLQSRSGGPPLRAGMTATVRIDTGRERRLVQLLGGSAAAGKVGASR